MKTCDTAKKIRALARGPFEKGLINGMLASMVRDRKSLRSVTSNRWAKIIGSERFNRNTPAIIREFFEHGRHFIREHCDENCEPFSIPSVPNKVPGVKKKSIARKKKPIFKTLKIIRAPSSAQSESNSTTASD